MSSTPTVALQLVTENDPTYPGLSPGVHYNAWVLTYTGVKPISHGPKPPPSNITCSVVGIYDLDNSAWTTLFMNCPG
jgi:hypothetical protein